MSDDEIRAYLLDIAVRLEVFANVLSLSSDIMDNARFNEPARIKIMLDSIICDELKVMSGIIIDDITEDE